jgi:hypothetical protein
MPSTDTEHVPSGQLADQAAHTIRLLNHRTRPATEGLAEPHEAAEIIAALAHMTGMLPQLLGQLGHWVEHEHHHDRLRVDSLAPLPDPDQTVHALTRSLQHAIDCLQRTAEELDTAHQHAAHLAATDPAGLNHRRPGPKFAQISGAKSLDETQMPGSSMGVHTQRVATATTMATSTVMAATRARSGDAGRGSPRRTARSALAQRSQDAAAARAASMTRPTATTCFSVWSMETSSVFRATPPARRANAVRFQASAVRSLAKLKR